MQKERAMRRDPASGRRAAVLSAVAGVMLLSSGMALAQSTDPLASAYAAEDPAARAREILNHPEVSARIDAWGLTPGDVQHDVDAMTPEQRVRLVYALQRPWPRSESYDEADYRAQYLVMVSLMRESQLFASIISSGIRGLQ
jgi:hypothetical protein